MSGGGLVYLRGKMTFVTVCNQKTEPFWHLSTGCAEGILLENANAGARCAAPAHRCLPESAVEPVRIKIPRILDNLAVMNHAVA